MEGGKAFSDFVNNRSLRRFPYLSSLAVECLSLLRINSTLLFFLQIIHLLSLVTEHNFEDYFNNMAPPDLDQNISTLG